MYLFSQLFNSYHFKGGKKAGKFVNEIIDKILKESGIKGVVVNSRIINALRKTIWLLKSKFDSMKKKGGASVRRLLDQWKSTTYAFTVYYQELDKASLLQENKEVRGQKRVLGENVVNEVAKRLKVEEKLQQAFAKSEKSSGFYKKRFKDLARKVARMNKKNLRGPQKNKSFSEYTQRHQSRIKTQLKDRCYSTLPFMGEYDFIATKVEIFNAETQEYDTLQLIDENELPFTESNPKTLNSDEIDDINLWIYIKDKYNISDQACMERVSYEGY